MSIAAYAVSLLLPRLTPPVAPVRERRFVTAQAGGAFDCTQQVDVTIAHVGNKGAS